MLKSLSRKKLTEKGVSALKKNGSNPKRQKQLLPKERPLSDEEEADMRVTRHASRKGGLRRSRKEEEEEEEEEYEPEEEEEGLKVACLNREVVVPKRGVSGGGFDGGEVAEGEVRGEFELSLQASGEEADNLDGFFVGVEDLKRRMSDVKATTRRLRELHRRSFDSEASPEEAARAREAFTRLVGKNEELLVGVRQRTMELKGVELVSDSFRKLKHNILNGMNMKTAKLLLDYKTVLNEHNQRLKDDTWRQLKEQRLDEKGDVMGDDEDDEYHKAAFDSQTEQVGDFMQKFVFREKASQAKRYLEEKHRELEIIERNMMELNELMRDFAVMVESANEPLDQIDTFLKGTKANMVQVEENLRQAKYKVLGMRKKKLFTAIGVAVVVIVVVAVVVGIVCLL